MVCSVSESSVKRGLTYKVVPESLLASNAQCLQDAIAALNSLQSNEATVQASLMRRVAHPSQNVEHTAVCLRHIGIEVVLLVALSEQGTCSRTTSMR